MTALCGQQTQKPKKKGLTTMSTQLPLCDASGPVTDLLQKLSGDNGHQWLRDLNRFLRKENPWEVPQTFNVTTTGRSGEDSIVVLKEQGFHVGSYVEELFRSKEFVATNDKLYTLAVIGGDEFEDDQRTNRNIRAEADRRGWEEPPVELASYLREQISDDDLERMGLWALILMHNPISDSRGSPSLLGLDRVDDGRCLSAFFGHPGRRWYRDSGFLFLVPASN
jgi:hypothetical protein